MGCWDWNAPKVLAHICVPRCMSEQCRTCHSCSFCGELYSPEVGEEIHRLYGNLLIAQLQGEPRIECIERATFCTLCEKRSHTIESFLNNTKFRGSWRISGRSCIGALAWRGFLEMLEDAVPTHKRNVINSVIW